ncbi:MAG: hypothetical protein ABR595_10080 [Psychroflexus sp.]
MDTQDLEKIISLLSDSDYLTRYYELVNYPKSNSHKIKCIEISFSPELLLEFEQIKKFKSSNNRYFKHPADSNIPCQAHYHIIGSKGNYEIYAVNLDGCAHHRQNKNYEIPKKEADELRRLGVKIRPNNIIEMIEASDLKQVLNEDYNRFSYFIMIL